MSNVETKKIAASPNSTLVSSMDGTIKLLNIDNGKVIWQKKLGNSDCSIVALFSSRLISLSLPQILQRFIATARKVSMTSNCFSTSRSVSLISWLSVG